MAEETQNSALSKKEQREFALQIVRLILGSAVVLHELLFTDGVAERPYLLALAGIFIGGDSVAKAVMGKFRSE